MRQRNVAGASIEELLWELWSRSGLAPAWQKASAGPGILGDEANRNLDRHANYIVVGFIEDPAQEQPTV